MDLEIIRTEEEGIVVSVVVFVSKKEQRSKTKTSALLLECWH